MWACHSAPGRVRQPSGSVPSWNLSREAQCVIFKQKESSSLAAGRKSRVCGWVGGWARGHVHGGRACVQRKQACDNRACVLGHGAQELGAFRLGAFRLGGGRSLGNRVCLCEGVCVCVPPVCVQWVWVFVSLYPPSLSSWTFSLPGLSFLMSCLLRLKAQSGCPCGQGGHTPGLSPTPDAA